MSEAPSLIALLSRLPDPRIERSREHELSDLLAIAVCTLPVGGESFYDMADFGHAREEWLRRFLRLPGGIPSHDTFNRLFQALDPAAFAEAFAQWTQGLRQRLDREVIALDGKAARRATQTGQSPRHLVSGWATENGLTLGQLQVAEKSNEITAVPALLRQLELAGCLVTADALHCQKTIAREITEADADYVLALKGIIATTRTTSTSSSRTRRTSIRTCGASCSISGPSGTRRRRTCSTGGRCAASSGRSSSSS